MAPFANKHERRTRGDGSKNQKAMLGHGHSCAGNLWLQAAGVPAHALLHRVAHAKRIQHGGADHGNRQSDHALCLLGHHNGHFPLCGGTKLQPRGGVLLSHGGALVIDSARKKGVTIYPVDSEHSAIFQCLQGNSHNKISKIFLTASGGPFFGKTEEDLKEVTVAQALNHPNWSMGAKITVDSATLMNKGLELIEAMWLFGVDASQVEIVVHRESVLHSAVEYQDGSVIGQLGNPDMKIPIQYALLYPNRVDCDVKRLSFTDYGKLTFSAPDIKTFKCLGACIESAKNTDTTMPVIANSANEEAVSLFLAGKIKFLQIGELVSKAVKNVPARKVLSLDDIITADKIAREFVKKEEVAI